jgi:hypothetical protein
LSNLVRGNWKEAQENTARFADLEVGDFERICEFAYRGDYEDLQPQEIDINVDADRDSTVLSTSIVDRYAKADRTKLAKIFTDYQYGSFKLSLKSIPGPGWSEVIEVDRSKNGYPDGNSNGWNEDITDVLLVHARIYVFADKYLAQGLADLCLHKLHKYLTNLGIYPSTCKPIIALLHYAYRSLRNHGGDFDEALDPLRALVLNFVIIHRGAFSKFRGHLEMLTGDSEYAVDFADKMMTLLDIACGGANGDGQTDPGSSWDQAGRTRWQHYSS